jgi:outer membrane protein OmpA-like peptidoglycan-associated protein
MLSYPFNESNAYVTTDGNRMFFNSSENINNPSGLSDMNDVWIRNKINGVWGSPINLTEINTIEDELILGLGESDLIILRSGFINYYDINNQYKLLKTEKINGFTSNYNLLSGSINNSQDKLFLSYEGFGTYGVEDIYVSKKNNNEWGRLSNIGSSVNSDYQDISPFLYKKDTLVFISNREEVGYELYFTVLKDKMWSEPIKMTLLNTSKSESSLTFDYNSSNFILSATTDSKTNSDLFFYADTKTLINVTFNLNSEISKGYLYHNSDTIPFSSNVFSFPIDSDNTYNFKFVVDNYFIKDTTFVIDKSVEISINLDEIKSGSRVVLKNLIFKQSSTDLEDESLLYLRDLLHLFRIDPDIQITIEGHTDNRGDFRSNIKLSRERSEVIKNFLVINGIKKSQIKVKGLGPTKPRFSNDSEESRKLNRRVEILIN